MKRDARRRMLTTTAKLLQRQGYHGTGLNQIVAEAEAPKGSIYFHFPGGKEQLAAEAIVESGAYLDRALAACEGPTTLGSLDAFLAQAATLLEQTDYTCGCPIATVALEVAPGSAAMGAACQEALVPLVDRVAGWLERDGFGPDEARERAELVYAAHEGALIFAKVRRSREPLDALRRQLPLLLAPAEPVAAGRSRRTG